LAVEEPTDQEDDGNMESDEEEQLGGDTTPCSVVPRLIFR